MMIDYDLKRRYKIYVKMRKAWNFNDYSEMYNNKACFGFCFWTSDNGYREVTESIHSTFPELEIVEPKKHGKYWFSTKESGARLRRVMLDYVIRYTAYKILLVYATDVLEQKPRFTKSGMCSVIMGMKGRDGWALSIEKDLPELLSLKPKHTYPMLNIDFNITESAYWFEPHEWEDRKRLIEKAIKILKKNVKRDLKKYKDEIYH